MFLSKDNNDINTNITTKIKLNDFNKPTITIKKIGEGNENINQGLYFILKIVKIILLKK